MACEQQLAEAQAKIAELESYIGYWEGSDITTADYIKQLEQKLEAGWIKVCQSGELRAQKLVVEQSSQIADLTAQLEEARKDAYSIGYEQGHNDTVEGAYSPELRLEDYLAAMKE